MGSEQLVGTCRRKMQGRDTWGGDDAIGRDALRVRVAATVKMTEGLSVEPVGRMERCTVWWLQRVSSGVSQIHDVKVTTTAHGKTGSNTYQVSRLRIRQTLNTEHQPPKPGLRIIRQ